MKNWMQSARRLFAALALGCSALAQAAPAFEVAVSGHGRPLILIPGLASPAAVWDGLVAELAKTHECHVLQLAGFAGTAPIAEPLLAQTESQLRRYIADKGLRAPVVIGHSLGGFLALKLAAGADAPVARAVVVDALPAFGALRQPETTPAQLRAVAQQMRAQMEAQDPAGFAAGQRAALARMISGERDRAWVGDASARSDRGSVIRAMAEMVGEDLRPALPTVQRPVLVLGSWAAYQPYASAATVEAMYRQQYQGLAGLQLEMAPEGLHFLMLDQPQWTLERVRRFLDS